MKALAPEMPAIFFSADEDEGKVLVMAQVPTSVIKDKGLKANEWCQQVSTTKICYLTKQTSLVKQFLAVAFSLLFLKNKNP